MKRLSMLKKALKNKRYGLPIAFLLFLFIMGIFYYIQQQLSIIEILSAAQKESCVLEYGKWECIDGKIAIPFYNSGEKDVTFTSVTIPVKNGENTYNVEEPLKSGETGALTTANCDEVVSENFTLKWCCNENCFTTPMNKPNPDIFLEH